MDIWGAFVRALEQILLTFQSLTGNAGIAIILFTIIARLVILPLTLSSLRSTRKMQVLQPQMKELQRKYGKDPQKLNEETIRLYRENKVNPAGGCLPMLLQLPIFFGVYQAVIRLTQVPPSEEAARAMLNGLSATGADVAPFVTGLNADRLIGGFLWLPDLGIRDPLYILPVLSVVLQLVVQLMSTPRIQDPQQKAMMQSMLILPIVFGYIGFTFPSGAVLYWVMGSVLSMIQTYVISGWGSLANYLKFLPTHGGLLPAPEIVTSSERSEATPAAVQTTTRAVTPTANGDSTKRSFWDVLGPLNEQPAPATAGADAHMGASDETTEEAIAEVRRQINQPNPRRRKTRR